MGLEETLRQQRITKRGKSVLDKVLDDDKKRQDFLDRFKALLKEEDTIYFDNSNFNVTENVISLYEMIKKGGL